MSKYLFIDGGSFSADYAAVTFEDDFKGSKLELWNRSNEAGDKSLDYDENDVAFGYEAMELDEATVDQMQQRMDYDDSKHANYFKVEE